MTSQNIDLSSWDTLYLLGEKGARWNKDVTEPTEDCAFFY
jgi:hypothetical protein